MSFKTQMRYEEGLITSKISLTGALVVLAVHAAFLYGLWSYRLIPTAAEMNTIMVNMINPPPQEQPEPPRPKPRTQSKPKPVEQAKPKQLVVEAPAVVPDEPIALPELPQSIIVAPIQPPQPPVQLANNLSASCPERTPPEYPLISKRMEEQGRVVLQVALDKEGWVGHIEVRKSSGFQRLDAAAVNAVKSWRCNSALQNGVSVPAVALQPFVFVLEGR